MLFSENRRGIKYNKVADEIKYKFISEVIKRSGTIKSAAEKYEINFSTAKAILHTYRKEGRIGRKSKRHNRNPCFLKSKKKINRVDQIQSNHNEMLFTNTDKNLKINMDNNC